MVAKVAWRLDRRPPRQVATTAGVTSMNRSAGSPTARTAVSLSISASIESRLTLPGLAFTWDRTSMAPTPSASSPSATSDGKITALNKTRNELIAAAEEKSEAAKTAGWKVRELSDAGLVVPRATAAPAKRRHPRPHRQPPTRPPSGSRSRGKPPIPSPLILYATTAESRAAKHGFAALRVSQAKSFASSLDTSAPAHKLWQL